MNQQPIPLRTNPVRRALADAARAWNMPERGVVEVWIAPIAIALAGAATALAGKSTYKWFTGEDGFAETMQVVFYGLALMFCLFVIRRLWRSGRRGFAMAYTVVAIGLVFMVSMHEANAVYALERLALADLFEPLLAALVRVL